MGVQDGDNRIGIPYEGVFGMEPPGQQQPVKQQINPGYRGVGGVYPPTNAQNNGYNMNSYIRNAPVNGITEDEFIDRVQTFLNVSCLLPTMLTPQELKRLIQFQVLPWFYRKYQYATERTYYYIPHDTLLSSPDGDPQSPMSAGAKYCYLPPEVMAVVYSPYIANQSRLFSIGSNPAIMNVEIGLNQAYTPSFLTSLGEFGIYRGILDSFADALNEFRKNTTKYTFSPDSKRLMILTSVPKEHGLIVEVEAKVPPEFMYENDLVYKMSCGYALQSMAMVGSRFDIPLPGDAKLNVADLRTQGERMVSEVIEEIGKITNSSFLFISRR